MRSLSDKAIFNLIGLLYEIANTQSPEAWSEVFTRLSTLLSSGSGSLSLYSPDDKRFDIFASTLDAQMFEEYNIYYQYVSPFRSHLLQMNSGDRFNRAENCSDKIFLETEIYQEYFKKQDVFNYEYQVLFKKGKTVAGVSFSRPKEMENFNARENKLMQLIVPHLQKAFLIHMKFAEIQREKQIMFESFEKISQGLIVLSKSGKVIFLNQSASKLIVAKDGLQLNHGGILVANFAHDSKNIKKLLHGVFEPTLDERESFGGVLRVSRRSGARPLSVFISPFSESSRNIFNSEKLALLFINNPEQQAEDIETILCRLYGLTPSESKIAAILARGTSLNDACEMIGIKQNTIRTHLKRIFSKTETNRQSELIKLILSNYK